MIKIENTNILTVNENMDVLEGYNLYIKDDKIYKIVSVKDDSDIKADKVIDGRKKILMPGMINMHTHVPMTILRNFSDDVALHEWLNDIIWPIEAKLTRDDIRISTRLGIIEMIQNGITFLNDMYYELDVVADEVDKSGMRALLGRGITEKETMEESNDVLRDISSFYEEFNNTCDGRVFASFAPHSMYTNSVEYLSEVGALAKKYDPLIHIHLSETKKELEDSLSKYGKTPVEIFDEVGLLSEKTIAAHCVWLTDEDIALLKKRKVNVVHNPSSNLKLASGVAPIDRLIKEGINVSLGTDGASSNNHLDLFKEMHLASLVQKGATFDPKALSKEDALRMATINGAKALGLDDKLGSIEEGKLADLILLDMDKVNHYPKNNILSNLVYSSYGSDVSTVIINGKIVMEDKVIKTIDVKDTFDKVDEVMEDLVNR